MTAPRDRCGGPLRSRRPAVRATVSELRHAVVHLAERHGAPARRCEDLALAVSEAVGNVVLHAYPVGEPGPVTLEAWIEGAVIVVQIEDEGRGMAPRADSPGLGLGLPLITGIAESFQIEDRPAGPGTRMRMRVPLR